MIDSKDFRVIFITHYAELYGANKSLLNLIEGIKKKGVSDIIVILPTEGKILNTFQKEDIHYKIIPFVNETYYIGSNPFIIKKIAKLLYNWYIVIKYAGVFKSKKKTIIHSNSSASLIGAYFSFFLRLKHVWHIREFGLEDYRYKYNFGNSYFQFWLNKSKACIAISKAIYNKRLKYCNTKIKSIIYNAVVTLPELEERKQLMAFSDKNDAVKTFGIIGNISPEKGQAEAIEALRLLSEKRKDILLIIAGTGNENYVNNLLAIMESNSLKERITFTGYLDDTSAFYKQINCLLMCSKNEGLGRVTIEAMSYGVPVIGYNNAGTSEIIQHEHNGLLYLNGASELCKMMEKFIENDTLANTMKQNAFKSVKDYFTIESYSESVLKVYEIL